MNYISLIEELKKRGSIPGLDAIQGLLEELGHPEDDLKIVHIAGTNGKGSVFAYLSSILRAAGFKVGRYISPTISCYEERFQINGTYIAKDKLERLYGVVEEAMRKEEAKTGLRPTLLRWRQRFLSYILRRKRLITPWWKLVWEEGLMPRM